MATVDSLVIALGLDPQGLLQGLSRAQDAVQQAGRQLTQAGRRSGAAFQVAGQSMRASGRQVQSELVAIGRGMERLGGRWQGMISGMIRRFALPLTSLAGAGAMVNSYLGGVAQVARMSGMYTTQMEEWRKKRELLSRVTREDVELYRKGKLALLDFNFAMASLSTTVMRALSPVIRVAIDWLNRLSDWIRRNEPNIVRFFTVLAGVITAVLLPAIVKLGVAMLANPITLIIAGILALTLVIDDLITYLNGGQTAFGELWGMIGVGPELMGKLRAAWESFAGYAMPILLQLKDIAELAFARLAELAGWAMGFLGRIFDGLDLGAFQAWIESLIAMFTSCLDLIKALFSGNFQEAGAIVADIFRTLCFETIPNMLSALGSLIVSILSNAFQELVNLVPKMFSGVTDFFKGMFGFGGDTPEVPSAAPALPTNAQLTQAAVPLAASNTRNTRIDSKTNIQAINIHTQATDAEGIMHDARSAAESQFSNLGVMAAEGGVSQ